MTRDEAIEILRAARGSHSDAVVRDLVAGFLNVGGARRRAAAERLSGLLDADSDIMRAVDAYLHRRPARRAALPVLDGRFDISLESGSHSVAWYWTTAPDGASGVVGEIDGQRVETSWAAFRRRVRRLGRTPEEDAILRQYLGAF